MERADENLLPAVYKEVSEAFNAGPSDLGYLTFIRNFVQGISSPLAGILVINYDRPTILAMGTFCWALSTAAVSACNGFMQVAFWRAINGFGLAIVIPALQSFIADSYKEGVRGAGFGLLSFVGTVGGIGGGVMATVMAGQTFWGIQGWRCAFVLMASLSAFIGFLVLLYVDDPRKRISGTQNASDSSEKKSISLNFKSRIHYPIFTQSSAQHCLLKAQVLCKIGQYRADDLLNASKLDGSLYNGNASVTSIWRRSWAATKSVIKVPTFQIIVLQGIIGSLPWTAMVFFTMWFELIGFDNNTSATLLSLFAIGCAIGSFVGGSIADRMSQTYPYSARIMCAQFSAFMGIPFSWFLLKIIPQSVTSFFTYSVTLFLMGLTISWNGTAANAPMFAEVVPVKHRTMIYAFDRAFEGSFSSVAAPLVGILAEKMFGYNSKSVDPLNGSPAEALALSKGLLSMMAIPFGLCCLCYTPLYYIFKKDRENARMQAVKEEEMM
ncbi:hypothetical protein TSUD_233410 [Trifolium subterraneum]|uniref:Major facilitator superfamily (MFS) profile domain-containing protein n=1 Tax=Trifolium subterraneum TaxID=3900 RepID=A0A2Z6MKK4_TRISU|nr:hypothetical protein TSUD_233410 [Trifolium subterraneum]